MGTEAGYFPLNTTCVQGDSVPYTFYFTDGNGVPLDVSSWQFFFTVKTNLSDSDDDALVALDPSDMTISDGNGTKDKLEFTAESAGIAVGTKYQDLQTVRSGIIKTIGKGQFVVEAQVTVRTTE